MQDASSATAQDPVPGKPHEKDSSAVPPSYLWRIALVMGGWTTIHYAIVAGLVFPRVPGGIWTLLVVYALLLTALGALLHSFHEEAYPGKWRRLLVTRPFWYAQVALLLASPVGALAWLAGLPFGRALAWGGAAALAALTFTAALALVGYVGSKALVVRERSFSWPDLPPAFDGLRIVQLSDIHVGPHTSERFLRRIVRAVERARPDVIAHTGDQVDDYHEDAPRYGRVFGPLAATHGAFAVAGNHDVYAGWQGVRDGLEKAGIRVLVNDATPIRREGEEIWIVGTGDPAGLRSFGPAQPDVAPDIAKSLARVPPGAFRIALAHNPALWPALAARGVHLTLSGHTHHGQISIPFLRWCLASPFLEHAMGTYERGASKLHISPGTNYWGLPLRIGAWPEVTVVTLCRGD